MCGRNYAKPGFLFDVAQHATKALDKCGSRVILRQNVGMGSTRLVRFIPDGGNRASQRLRLGALTITVTSKATMRHLTLRFRCRSKQASGKWKTVPFTKATHIFIEDYDWEPIATLYPKKGVLYFAPKATEAARWCVVAVFRLVNGDYSVEKEAELTPEDICIRCGRSLTDPESIERGFGPECYGLQTESKSVRGAER